MSRGAGRPWAATARGGRDLEALLPLGLAVFLCSLLVLFATAVVGYLWVRGRSAAWPPAGAAALPGTLWLGTAILAASSGAMHRALRAIGRGDQGRLSGWLRITLLLALSFVAAQIAGWVEFSRRDAAFETHVYGFTFYMLTGLHALHVLGGIAALGWVAARAARGRYHWAAHGGVRLVSTYWHFLTAVWVVVFGLLLAGR